MKFKIFLIFCMLCTGAISGRAQSGDFGDNLHWELADSVLTISWTGAMPGSIPWNDYRENIVTVDIQNGVTNIGSHAFYRCTNLTSITIPTSVTSIEGGAFAECSSLTSVTIPNSVTLIWDQAFRQCSSLTSVTNLSLVPQGIVDFSNGVFWDVPLSTDTLFVPACALPFYQSADVWKNFGTIVEEGETTSPCNNPIASGTTGSLTWTLCSDSVLTISGTGAMPDYEYNNVPWKDYRNNIIAVDIQTGVTSIGNTAFYGCNSLTSIMIPNSVTSIGSYAFAVCSSLTSVSIPNSVESIGYYAFVICTNLTSVTIPGSVTSIGGGAFERCSSLASINVDDANSDYSSEAGILYNKDKTILMQYPAGKTETSFSIPGSVASIGSYAFTWCNNLTSVTIPGSVTSIEGFAFADCYNLTSVTIPGSVTSIGDGVFSSCSSLASINVDDANSDYSSEAGILYNKDKTVLMQYPAGKTETSFSIPSSVTSIGYVAFVNCYNLTSVTIPGSVTSIGDQAFAGCSSLVSVTIPSSVTNIDAWVFYCCSNLTSVTILGSVENIEAHAFSGCTSVTSIIIPGSVTSIGEEAFTYCDNLQNITVEWPIPLNISDDVFERINKNTCILHVPEGSKAFYQAADVWKDFGTIVEIGDVTGVSLDQTSLDLLVDSTAQLTATVLPENAANKNVTWSSTNEAVATVSSSGLVTAKAAGTATITVTTEDGNFTAECLVSVQKPEETIVVEETKPAGADGNGTIELSLNIPSDASFVGFFYMEFPSGLVLNQMLTTLVMELVPYYDLTISQVSEGKWLFVIRQKTLRGKQDLTYSKIMDIVYHVEEGTEDGAYNLEISDLKFDFDDGTSIEIPELSVPVTVDQTYTGIRNASSEKPTASVKDNVLRVKSPVSERISVYSTNGILLYMNDKQAGEAFFNIGPVSDKILIVKGNSGWVKKVKMVNK